MVPLLFAGYLAALYLPRRSRPGYPEMEEAYNVVRTAPTYSRRAA